MDDNTAKVLIAAVGALGGLITGLAVAIIGGRRVRQAEQDRRAHDDSTRWLSDRRSLYARFILEASEMTDRALSRVDADGLQRGDHGPIDRSALERAYSEMRLLASPEVMDPVARLYATVIACAIFTSGPADEAGDTDLPGRRHGLFEELGPAWGAAVGALREDLGVGPEPDFPPKPI